MPGERTDLNLFRMFQAIMEHQSLSAAARELGITPSAVSHALNRLRTLVMDELFVVGTRSMVPTQRAVELAPSVAQALGTLDLAIAKREFVPASSERQFRVGMSANTSQLLLPALLERMLVTAPQVKLRIVPIGRVDVVAQLNEGRLDLVITWFGKTPERIKRRRLYTDQETMVVREGHPLAKAKPTKSALLSFPHVVVELTGTEELEGDGFHTERGLLRRVWIERLLVDETRREQAARLIAVTVPEALVVPPILKVTNLVATLPLSLALRAVREGGLAIIEPPYKPLQVQMEAAWHERNEQDPSLQWFVDELAAIGKYFGPLA